MVNLRLGDCLDLSNELEDGSVDLIVTSPPYYGKFDYQNGSNQIGLEATPREYIERLGAIYHALWRVMAEGATLWIVIADTYNNVSPVRKNQAERKSSIAPQGSARRKLVSGYREKELFGIPFLLVDKLRWHGFVWRSLNIWHKPACGYDRGTDRPTLNHEYVIQFVKAKGNGRPYANIGRIDGSVWTIPPESYKGHPCPFPVELAARIIRALPKGLTVFDPMMGTGSSIVAAQSLGYDSIGFEVNPSYFAIAERRIAGTKKLCPLPPTPTPPPSADL